MKDLAEALSFGVRIALEEHALQLKTLTEEKVARMKAESQHQKMEAMKELEHKIHQESENALRHLREASEAETDIMKSRLRGEMAAEHAARVNRLQIEVGSKRSSTERELRTKYENEYLSTMKEMDEMRRRLQREHTPALQTFREGALEKRSEALAEEDLRIRAQLDSEMSVLRGRLDSETRKAVEIQRRRMIDEHR